MLVGVPKEIKAQEFRVGMVPSSVREIVARGASVIVEAGAGSGIGISDEAYIEAGASIEPDVERLFECADMIIKVKEPQEIECKRLRDGQILFTYLHLAPDPSQAELLKASGCTAIAYETVTDSQGGLPLLTPMSQVAGRLSIQAGASTLEKGQGGSGILLGGVPGVAPAEVVVIGGGVVGTNAIRMAMGMEASVTVLDTSLQRLQELDFQFGAKLNTIYSTKDSLENYIRQADLVVGAVLVTGAKAPKLVARALLKEMRPGSVMVDVAIDQGGCFETSKPTTHEKPTYEVDGIVHYCVANMPGAVPRTSTFALNNATLPFIKKLVTKGVTDALLESPNFLNGLNVHQGQITHQAVATALNQDFVEAATALK
jgi:alanine dehydrogenase